MRIAIVSDFHFGSAYNSELEEDSFENANEALEKASDSDLVLVLGDIFDSRIPRTEVWARAIKVLVKPLLKENTGIKLIHATKDMKEISKRTLRHLPVIAIHGTHERRGREEINAVDALENAGILVHLHCQTIVLEKDGIKVAVHGMSGVPERFAKTVLEQWNPQPIEGCFNILLLHQSIEPYVYSPLDPPSLSVSNLPKGFDMIIDGHIHQHNQIKLGNAILLFAGSTIVTQYEKNEADFEKGIYIVDINKEAKMEFVPLEKNRKFFYEEVFIEGDKNVKEQIENRIEEILKSKFQKPPIIRIKIYGKEADVLNQDLRVMEKKYLDKAIIMFAKELESLEVTRKIEFLRGLREQKLSIEEVGLEIFKKNLDEFGFVPVFDYESIFRMLSEGEVERTFNILLGEQKTLEGILRKSQPVKEVKP